MRKILLLSFLLLTLAPYTASISGAAVAAQTRSDSRSSRLNPKHNGRPRMPSRDYIDCTPGAGVISFEANFDFYAMTVIIGDEDAPILTASITPDDPTVEVGYLYGDYPVTCISDDGRQFYGTLHL